jgi:hypothetical protein
MSDDERRAELRLAYDDTKARLMEILYEEDPDGMGSTIGAPLDEYSAEVAHLMVALRGAETESEVKDVLTRSFEHVSDRLVLRVHETWVLGGGSHW